MKYYYFDYSNIEDKFDSFIKYAVKRSDEFSIISVLQRPFTAEIPKCIHEEMLSPISDFLSQQILNIHRWSNNKANRKHSVMNVYKSDKSMIDKLVGIGNFLGAENYSFPEDICFYKQKTIWLSTVSHEKLMILYSDDTKDLDFFIENDVQISQGTSSQKLFKLPKTDERVINAVDCDL